MKNDFRINKVLVQPSINKVVHRGKIVRLEPKPMRVLVALARRRGEAVSREELLREVWEKEYASPAVITRCIFLLRKAFKDSDRDNRIIETISKTGYRLAVPVHTIKRTARIRS